MKVLMTGGTGLVGTALTASLRADGHTVCRLLRKKDTDEQTARAGCDILWEPSSGELGLDAQGADAVVNLAGASIADGRWTDERKEVLRKSRVDTTQALVEAMARMSPPPRVLVSASATGIYGDRGDELLTEECSSRTDFLSRLAEEWEEEALRAGPLGMRVVLSRFGVILARDGGALPTMMAPFKIGAGAKLGSGKQWMSWVALDDVVRALRFALEKDNLSGPINVVSPHPVTNAEFTRVLAETMHRPALFTVPPFALRLLLGEMADTMLLASQRAVPRVLQESGYQFLYPDLGSALTTILKS